MNNTLRLGKRWAAMLCAAAVAFGGSLGCGSSKARAGKAAARGAGAGQSQVLATDFGNQADADRTDASRPPGDTPGGPARMRLVRLDIYQLRVPYRAISRNEEFWKHVDEEQVDVGTYDLLRKNGWRLGTAPSSEWGYFKDIIDEYPASANPTSMTAGAGGAGANTELLMKKGVGYQVLSYFTDANLLNLLSFDRYDNLLSISLHQVPRKPGAARVTVCPTVRSQKRRYAVKEGGREVQYVHTERLYDLNLQHDVPAGDFLVIAPSPEVRLPTNLGAAFLLEDGPAERVEHVLLLVPRAVTLEETTTTTPPAVRPPTAAARAGD